MWDYIKAAFFFRPHVPVLGHVPVNILALTGFAVLGFGHPGFWLLGLGLEAAYLYGLAANDGFRRYIESRRIAEWEDDKEGLRRQLTARLSVEAQRRFAELEEKCIRILHLNRLADADEHVLSSNQYALRELLLVYLKLLVGESNLTAVDAFREESSLTRDIKILERELNDGGLSRSVRESKKATLDILRRRLRNIERREQYLNEIRSNLVRIEAQIDLALENASMKGKPEFIDTDIDVAGSLLDDVFYGDPDELIGDPDEDVRTQTVEPENLTITFDKRPSSPEQTRRKNRDGEKIR